MCMSEIFAGAFLPQGDAFILAFHGVADAITFSSEVQMELLLAPWPKELFGLEVSAWSLARSTLTTGQIKRAR